MGGEDRIYRTDLGGLEATACVPVLILGAFFHMCPTQINLSFLQQTMTSEPRREFIEMTQRDYIF